MFDFLKFIAKIAKLSVQTRSLTISTQQRIDLARDNLLSKQIKEHVKLSKKRTQINSNITELVLELSNLL